MGLVLRHIVGIQRTLGESPTRFRPLLYVPDEKAQRQRARAAPKATAWCEGYMAGVKLRDDEWQPLYDAAGRARLDLPDRGARVRRSRRRLHRMGRQRREARRADRRAAGRRRADLPLLAGAARGDAGARHRQPPQRASPTRRASRGSGCTSGRLRTRAARAPHALSLCRPHSVRERTTMSQTESDGAARALARCHCQPHDLALRSPREDGSREGRECSSRRGNSTSC